ncbi:MAG: phosphoenolpyruvate--protein phosphotransferase [Betaproteobacteria bacterium]|nr:phosphoenolpyruvate--protein phosphotransferase [Betaproteobacteria bacterium]
MNFVLHGAPVSAGITIGYAHLVSSARLEVAQYEIAQTSIDAEVGRFDAALERVRGELREVTGNIPADAPAEFGAFVDLHRMILDDSTLSEVPRELIRAERCNAEWALVRQMEGLVAQFDSIEDPYLRERKADVQQVVERVLKALLGHPGPIPQSRDEQKLIVVAHDLSPADMILFKQHQFGGFVTDVGGVTSHTAILARSLGIPAIVGLHLARHMIRENDLLIVDGLQGVLIVAPDPAVLGEYQLRQSQLELERQKLRRLRSTPAITLDGAQIELLANIELPQDVEGVREAGAQGIGLFRTEFLFMNRRNLPSEDEQFEAYRTVVAAMRGLPVTIRTLDIGADKSLDGRAIEPMPNPALGLRAIRYCLAEPQIFLTQLRAILRASQFGRVRLLIPMLAHAHEIEQALALLRQAKASLADAHVAYDRGIEVGGMIEVPAAALALPMFTRRLNFLSLGTNDLIQYTLAIDRTDDAVAHLYDPLHPAVLHLVAHTIQSANRAGIAVAVCGEMAGDLALTRLLLGFGLRSFSMDPAQLLAVKERILRSSIAEMKPLAARVLRSTDGAKTREMLAKINA